MSDDGVDDPRPITKNYLDRCPCIRHFTDAQGRKTNERCILALPHEGTHRSWGGSLVWDDPDFGESNEDGTRIIP